jgi:aldose 1-epimerase
MSNRHALPTGEQFRIVDGDAEAVITEVGAGIRSFTLSGIDVLFGYAEDEECHSGRGQHLLPWPNRIRDGRYPWNGVDQHLALSEPERHNAIHGLTRFVPWQLVLHEGNRVTHALRLFPQTGWSGLLDLEITHTVHGNALSVDVSATNVGAHSTPYGYACHPYLTVGEGRVDDVSILIPASRYLEVDDRLLPVGIVDVDGTAYDCREAPALGERVLDTAYTGLAPSAAGNWEVVLSNGPRTSRLWGDGSCTWLQIFTGDTLKGDLRRRSGIAVEPMTCGPDAFNEGPTHDGVITLAPGEQHRLRWGITADLGV